MVSALNREQEIYWAVETGKLSIDDEGRIWRGETRAENTTGKYLQVRVMTAGTRIHALAHRIIWLHFNGPIPTGLTVNHKDGNGKNNHPTNLELATPSEQVIHSRRVLGHGDQSGEKNHQARLSSEQVEEIRIRRMSGEPLLSIAVSYGIAYQTVSKIARGTRRLAG
jgi:hypothetical protein